MKSDKKKITFEGTETTVVVDSITGEVKEEQKKVTRTAVVDKEPTYVKMYLDCLCKFKDMQVSLNPILLEFLKRMSYADQNEKYGGQLIYCNKFMKQEIAAKCGVSYKRVEQALTEFVKKNVFSRIAVGTYQVNPVLFGQGEWKDIRNIRATFDFGQQTMVAEIIKDEPEQEGETEVQEEKKCKKKA